MKTLCGAIEPTNPPRNISGQFWPCTLLSLLDFAPVTLNLDLYQMPALMSHFMHNKESHQGLHLGFLNVLNLEHVLKSWIASDFLKFLILAEINCPENTSSLFFFFYLLIYNSKIL